MGVSATFTAYVRLDSNPLQEVYRRLRPVDRTKGLNGSDVAFMDSSNKV